MITIRCTQLEQVKQNPQLYAESVLNGKVSTGGSHGMLACMKDIVKTVHTHERSIEQAVIDLQNKFVRFVNTSENKSRQDRLVEQMISYNRAYEKMGFEMIDGHRQIKWEIVPGVAKLSGFTPWVVENDKGSLFAYFIAEKHFDWKSELRFPLYQSYMSENTLKCDIKDLWVGIFNLSANKFDFENFTPKKIIQVINETSDIMDKVVIEFQKKKK